MKNFKTKFQFVVLFNRGLFVPLVFALALFCINKETHAQTYSDLDGATIDLLETYFEQEMEKLKDEVNNPQPGISIESNRNVFHYYNAVLTTFKSENVDIKEAFIQELSLLLQGPVGGHDLTQALFYRSLDDAPAFEQNSLEGAPMKNTTSTAPRFFFLTKEEFRTHLEGMSITPGNINKVKGLFTFIREYK